MFIVLTATGIASSRSRCGEIRCCRISTSCLAARWRWKRARDRIGGVGSRRRKENMKDCQIFRVCGILPHCPLGGKMTGFDIESMDINDMPEIVGVPLVHHIMLGSYRVVSGWQWAGRPPDFKVHSSQDFFNHESKDEKAANSIGLDLLHSDLSCFSVVWEPRRPSRRQSHMPYFANHRWKLQTW